jgi:hypothetical protein
VEVLPPRRPYVNAREPRGWPVSYFLGCSGAVVSVVLSFSTFLAEV